MLIPCEKSSLNPELYLEKNRTEVIFRWNGLKELSQKQHVYTDLPKEEVLSILGFYIQLLKTRKLLYTYTKISAWAPLCQEGNRSTQDISRTVHGKQWDAKDLKTGSCLEDRVISYRNLSCDGLRNLWITWCLSCTTAPLKFIHWTQNYRFPQQLYLEVLFSKISLALTLWSRSNAYHFAAHSLNHMLHFLFGSD